jgi:hypothetical protein
VAACWRWQAGVDWCLHCEENSSGRYATRRPFLYPVVDAPVLLPLPSRRQLRSSSAAATSPHTLTVGHRPSRNVSGSAVRDRGPRPTAIFFQKPKAELTKSSSQRLGCKRAMTTTLIIVRFGSLCGFTGVREVPAADGCKDAGQLRPRLHRGLYPLRSKRSNAVPPPGSAPRPISLRGTIQRPPTTRPGCR